MWTEIKGQRSESEACLLHKSKPMLVCPTYARIAVLQKISSQTAGVCGVLWRIEDCLFVIEIGGEGS